MHPLLDRSFNYVLHSEVLIRFNCPQKGSVQKITCHSSRYRSKLWWFYISLCFNYCRMPPTRTVVARVGNQFSTWNHINANSALSGATLMLICMTRDSPSQLNPYLLNQSSPRLLLCFINKICSHNNIIIAITRIRCCLWWSHSQAYRVREYLENGTATDWPI